MKKKFTNSLFSFLVLVMAFTLLPVGVLADEDNGFVRFYETYYHKDLFGQLLLNNNSEFIINYINSTQLLDEFYATFLQRTDRIQVHDYFGGIYINSNGLLTILVTEVTMEEGGNTLIRNFGDGDGVIIREVDFTYAMLDRTFNIVRDFSINYTGTDHPVASFFSGVLLDVINNQIIVGLTHYNQNNIDLFKEMVIDCATIVFEECEGFAAPENNYMTAYYIPEYLFAEESFTPLFGPVIRTGDRVVINGSFGSVGYRVVIPELGWVHGFITAAHVGNSSPGNIARNPSGQQIGVVERSILNGVDVAVVRLTNGASVQNHANLGAVWQSPTPGIQVSTRGSGSGIARSVNSGPIVGRWSGSFGHFHVDGILTANHATQSGDSGGVVYSLGHVSPSGPVFALQGMHAGQVQGRGVFIPLGEARTALLNRYGIAINPH